MELTPARSWKHEFARSTEVDRYREIVRKHLEDARRNKDDEDKKERKQREEALEELAVMVMTSQDDIDAYLVTIDHYNEASYEALSQNEQLLTALRGQREELFEKAYVLPDGTQVFESEDGIRVLDAHGTEIDPSIVGPDDIEDWRPKYEQVKALDDQEHALVEERTELLQYQTKLDEARERLEAGDISQRDFDAMKKDLGGAMPDRVRDNLPDEFRPERELEQSADLVIESAPLSRPGPMPHAGT